MRKRKQLFSHLGNVLAFCTLLAIPAFLPGAKAEAELKLNGINYEESTIEITTDSNDTTLYFSDKNKKKWETAMKSFDGNSCTMDISWVNVTKDYVMNFKGNKTTDKILTVTIPKQISNFKAKYDKKENKVMFTNKPSDRTVEYRINGTPEWKSIDNEDGFNNNLKNFYDNGSKIYFRLAAENGTSNNVGKRYSKEVLCSIPKKSEAPKITVNDDATITMKSGWQVRRVNIKESNDGIEYASGYDAISSVTSGDPNYDNTTNWYTYNTEQRVPVVKMAKELSPKEATTSSAVYLQFRKKASSSSQVSHTTTVKMPWQEEAPSIGDLNIEYTSFSTFNIKIANATTKNPYEYCIVNKSDVKGEEIIDPQDIKWKKVSSSVPIKVKKSEAPDESYLFLRKKAVGKIGDENFRLTTDYRFIRKISYPEAKDESLKITKPALENGNSIDLIDGVCTMDNENESINFQITTIWNAKIKDIYFTTSPNPTKEDKSVATVKQTSSVQKSGISTTDNKPLYFITATINEIKLAPDIVWPEDGNMKLYAYITYDTSEPVELSSNDTKGLVINLKKKSTIETIDDNGNKSLDIERIIGAKDSNEEIKFKVNLPSGVTIDKIKLGNYELENRHYTLNQNSIIVNLANLEKESELETYYGKKQNLIVELSNKEKLNDITVTFIEPVTLNKFYSWAYRINGIPDTKQQVVVQLPNGTSTTETRYVNNYSVEYTVSTKMINSIVTVKSATLKSATGSSISILDNFNNETNKIEFSNDILKNSCFAGKTNEPVEITFNIQFNGSTYDYVIKKGCIFTVLP